MQRVGGLKLIQELNRSIILRTICNTEYSPISLGEITIESKISSTTINKATARLIKVVMIMIRLTSIMGQKLYF